MARGIPYDGAGDVRVHVFANIVDTKKYGVIGTYLSILCIYLPAYLSYLLSSTYLSIFYLLSSIFYLTYLSIFYLACIGCEAQLEFIDDKKDTIYYAATLQTILKQQRKGNKVKTERNNPIDTQ